MEFLEVVEEENRETGVRVSIKHEETSGHPTSLKLDLSFRENPVEEPVLKVVENPYRYELPSCSVRASTLTEIMAEKIRAIIARGAPRDVYDVWFLLKRNVKINLELVARKLKILKKDRIFDEELFLSRVEEKAGQWNRDLGPLLGSVPDFDRVRDKIKEVIDRSYTCLTDKSQEECFPKSAMRFILF